MLTMTVQPSFHWHESVYVHAELSLRSQRTDERLGQKRLKPHKESHSPCLIVLAVLLNANSVTAAQPVLLLPAHMVVTLPSLASRGRRASIAVVVLPGLGLKWQCDQLCVESQPFFVLPAKESGAWAADPMQASNSHIHIWSLEAGCCNLELS